MKLIKKLLGYVEGLIKHKWELLFMWANWKINKQQWIVGFFALIGAGTVLFFSLNVFITEVVPYLPEDAKWLLNTKIKHKNENFRIFVRPAHAAVSAGRELADNAGETSTNHEPNGAGYGESHGENLGIERIADIIYQLESSGGKNDACRAKGRYNGFGYRVNRSESVCYDNPSDVRGLVEYWFSRKLEKYTIAQATCLYNSGIASDDCPYFRNFVLVSNQ